MWSWLHSASKIVEHKVHFPNWYIPARPQCKSSAMGVLVHRSLKHPLFREQLIAARFSCSKFGLLSCHRHCWECRLTFDPKIRARTELQWPTRAFLDNLPAAAGQIWNEKGATWPSAGTMAVFSPYMTLRKRSPKTKTFLAKAPVLRDWSKKAALRISNSIEVIRWKILWQSFTMTDKTYLGSHLSKRNTTTSHKKVRLSLSRSDHTLAFWTFSWRNWWCHTKKGTGDMCEFAEPPHKNGFVSPRPWLSTQTGSKGLSTSLCPLSSASATRAAWISWEVLL